MPEIRRSHKARRQTSWEALSRLPVAWAWCRTRGIKNGRNDFSPCFLFPLQWKNFSPAPCFTSAFGWWQADKSTAEYFLWASLPCRGKPTIPVESVLWVLTSSQHLLPTGSLSSLCRHLGRSDIQQTQGAPLQSFLSAIHFTQPPFQLKLFFHMFFSFMQLLEESKTNEVDLSVFPRLKGD